VETLREVIRHESSALMNELKPLSLEWVSYLEAELLEK
jgi:hypothetical protein